MTNHKTISFLLKNPAMIFGAVVLVVLATGLGIVMLTSKKTTENRSKAANDATASVFLVPDLQDADPNKPGLQVLKIAGASNLPGEAVSPNIKFDIKMNTGGKKVIAADVVLWATPYTLKNIKAIKYVGGRANPERFAEQTVLSPGNFLTADPQPENLRFIVVTAPKQSVTGDGANAINLGNVQIRFQNPIIGTNPADPMIKTFSVKVQSAKLVTEDAVIDVGASPMVTYELVSSLTTPTPNPSATTTPSGPTNTPTLTPTRAPSATPMPTQPVRDNVTVNCNMTVNVSPAPLEQQPQYIKVSDKSTITFTSNYTVTPTTSTLATGWIAGMRYKYNSFGDDGNSVWCAQNTCTITADGSKGGFLALWSNVHKTLDGATTYCKYDGYWSPELNSQNVVGKGSACLNKCSYSVIIVTPTPTAAPAATNTPAATPATAATATPTQAAKLPSATPTWQIVE